MGKHASVLVWTSEDSPVELIFYSHLSVGYHDGTLVRLVWQMPSPIEPFHGPVNPFTKQNENENRRSYRSLPHIAQEKVLFKEELRELSKFALEWGRVSKYPCYREWQHSAIGCLDSEQLNFSRRVLSLCLLPSPQCTKSGGIFCGIINKNTNPRSLKGRNLKSNFSEFK